MLIQALMYLQGVPFDNDRNTEITMDDVNAYMATLSPEESAQMQAMTSGMSDLSDTTAFLSVTKG